MNQSSKHNSKLQRSALIMRDYYLSPNLFSKNHLQRFHQQGETEAAGW